MQPVAVGVLMKDGHVLACQRKRTARYPLKWEFPGGKIEPRETAWEALVRELREELTIEAERGEEFHRQEWTYPEGTVDPAGDGTFRVFYYLIRSFSGEPTNQAFEQICWVRPAELLGMDILEGNREAVVLLVKHALSHRTDAGSL
jgi:8-oxo-dGTP diphosphatase